MAGASKTIATVAVATAFRVLYWWRQHCKQISNGRLEIFKKIINLLTVTVLFLFTFFTLILDAPRTFSLLMLQTWEKGKRWNACSVSLNDAASPPFLFLKTDRKRIIFNKGLRQCPSPPSLEHYRYPNLNSTPGLPNFSRHATILLTQSSGSMTFWCGSGSADPCLWLMDSDPDWIRILLFFVIDLQDANKKLI